MNLSDFKDTTKVKDTYAIAYCYDIQYVVLKCKAADTTALTNFINNMYLYYMYAHSDSYRTWTALKNLFIFENGEESLKMDYSNSQYYNKSDLTNYITVPSRPFIYWSYKQNSANKLANLPNPSTFGEGVYHISQNKDYQLTLTPDTTQGQINEMVPRILPQKYYSTTGTETPYKSGVYVLKCWYSGVPGTNPAPYWVFESDGD